MPSRMPNWKMRAKALADGIPMTRLCKMPSRGSICMMRTSLSTSVDRHDAVGVEHDREVVVLAPAFAEIADIAGLEADIVGATPVGERDAPAPELRKRREACVLGRGDVGLAGVAQHIDMEAFADAARRKAREHRLQQPRDPVGRLVADAQKDGGRGGNRLVAAHTARHRRDRRDRVARKAHDQKADGRVPESDHVPRQCHREEHDQDEVDGAEAAGRERDDGEPDQARDRQSDAREEQGAAAKQAGRGARRSPRRGGSVPTWMGFACLFGRFEDIAADVRVQSGEMDHHDDLWLNALQVSIPRLDRGPGVTTEDMSEMRAKALWYVGPGRAELREEAVAAPESGEVAGARAVRRRSAGAPSGWSMPAGCRRASMSACARRSWAGAFPFPVKYGYATVGRVESGPADLQDRDRVQPASAPERLHAAGGRRRSGSRSTCRRRAPCSPPTWRPRSMRSGTARPVRPTGSPSSAAGSSGSLVALSVRAAAGRRGDGRRYRARTRGARPRAGRPLCACRTTRRAIAISSFTPAPALPASRPRCGSPARRRAWSS